MCDAATRGSIGWTVGTFGTEDTLELLVINDTTKQPAGSPVSLTLKVDTTSIGTLIAGDARLPTGAPVGKFATGTIRVVKTDDGRQVCWVALAPARSLADSVMLGRIRSAQRELENRRAWAEVTGQSFLILSLIKSIAGEIPEDEFFDIRLKFALPLDSTHLARVLAGEPLRASQRRVRDSVAALQKRQMDSLGVIRDTALHARIQDSLKAAHRMTRDSLKAAQKYTFSSLGYDNPPRLRLFTTASLDVSLSSRSTADTTAADSTRGKRLTDASAALNWTIGPDYSLFPVRTGYASVPYFKIFNANSYLGVGYTGPS
jgi:hypothetical protein